MNIQQAIALIDGITPLLPQLAQTQRWADLGCGTGLFTEALARLLPAGSTVYGVDTKPSLPHSSSLIPVTADFEKDDLDFRDLDGILMANSLHYIRDKPALLKKLRTYMLPEAPLIIIEYDTDQPVSTWVPYPLSYVSLTKLFSAAGYTHIKKLGERSSVYGRANIYSVIVTPSEDSSRDSSSPSATPVSPPYPA